MLGLEGPPQPSSVPGKGLASSGGGGNAMMQQCCQVWGPRTSIKPLMPHPTLPGSH